MKRKTTIGLKLLSLFFLLFIGQSWASSYSFEDMLAPPVNDDCANATTITVNQNYLCGNVTSGTLLEATASSETNSCNTPTNANDDVWFKFTATDIAHTIDLLNISGNLTDLFTAVYDSGTSGSCNSLTPIFCTNSDSFDLDSNVLSSDLTVGNIYFLRIYTNGSASGANTTFDVCVGTAPTVPDNDACADAEAITSLPFNQMYDASGATNNSGFISASGVDCDDMNDGVWYTITGDGNNFTFTVTPTGWDAAIGVYTGSCGSFTCEDFSDLGGNNIVEAVNFNTTNGTTYYINIGNASGTVDGVEGVFNLGVTSTVLSIEDIVAKGFVYYPNPVSDRLRMSANEPIEALHIYNILGSEVKRIYQSDNFAEVNFSELPSGTYFVRAKLGDATGSFKVIKL